MFRFFIVCFAAAALSACHPEDPRRTGLHAVARTILPASIERLGACLEKRLAGPSRQRAAPDGGWRQFADAEHGDANWALRLTRIDGARTEVEIDARLRDTGAGATLAGAAASCAGM
jgi:hypothetical protein